MSDPYLACFRSSCCLAASLARLFRRSCAAHSTAVIGHMHHRGGGGRNPVSVRVLAGLAAEATAQPLSATRPHLWRQQQRIISCRPAQQDCAGTAHMQSRGGDVENLVIMRQTCSRLQWLRHSNPAISVQLNHRVVLCRGALYSCLRLE